MTPDQLPDISIIQLFSNLGVGGILAGIIFYFYHKDSSKKKEECEKRENQLINVVNNNTLGFEKLCHTVSTLSDSLKRMEDSKLAQMEHLLEKLIGK